MGWNGGKPDVYDSPFAIQLDGSIGVWTSDYAAREALILSESSPHPDDWYITDYGTLSYGPLNPQLYSSGSLGEPSLAVQLKYDRGDPVLNVPTNTVPVGVDPILWQQQRLMAAANSLLVAGTAYQHLHLPTFDPESVTGPTFPWSKVSSNDESQTSQQLAGWTDGTVGNPYKAYYGKPAPGIDCTDFSAYVYNLALGIQMHSGTSTQITYDTTPSATIADAAGNAITPTFLMGPHYGEGGLNAPGSLDPIIAQLQPGDLLYMKVGSSISHVVIWLGEYGTLEDGSPSPVPLVISSHDNTPAIFDINGLTTTGEAALFGTTFGGDVTVSNGTWALDPTTGYPLVPNGMTLEEAVAQHLPPPGVHILPFTPDTWFYQNFAVAMQVVPEPSTSWLVLFGVCGLLGSRRRRGRERGRPARD